MERGRGGKGKWVMKAGIQGEEGGREVGRV